MPATVHLVGATIALRQGVPWIADYRDPWSGNPGVQRGPLRATLEVESGSCPRSCVARPR